MSFEVSSLSGVKAIANASSTASTILYIVPPGRMFTGTVVLNSSALAYIGDPTVAVGPTAGTSTAIAFPVTLGPGMMVKAGSGTVAVYGVES